MHPRVRIVQFSITLLLTYASSSDAGQGHDGFQILGRHIGTRAVVAGPGYADEGIH